MKTDTRKAAFAGSWYPADPAECRREIEGFLQEGVAVASPNVKRLGGVVPHAGWYFSGSIACNVIAQLRTQRPPDVVVVFGMHLGPESPPCVMAERAWETPLGPIEIDREICSVLISDFSLRVETALRHSPDNTIELQLPFIKYLFPEARLVAVGVPPVTESLAIGEAVADMALRRGLTVKVLGSTDLTHYGPNYGYVPKGTGPGAVKWVEGENDRRVIDRMLALDPGGLMEEALAHHNACCSGAAATAIAATKRLGAVEAEMLYYSTSYDKSPGTSFVGYTGVVF